MRKNFFGRPGLKRFLLASRQQQNCNEIPQPGARQFLNLEFTIEMLDPPVSAKSGRLRVQAADMRIRNGHFFQGCWRAVGIPNCGL
ncbi:MAG: hypothetical protein DMG96_31580 [Acidobacteria bacterium]|nr:MAG: hypothetical protein DMG96_31580 [Acidobacteriota bacterium]